MSRASSQLDGAHPALRRSTRRWIRALALARAGRDPGPARPERQRQDHDAPAARRVRGARTRAGSWSTGADVTRAAGRWRGASAWCSSTTRSSPISTSGATCAFGLEARGVRGGDGCGAASREALALVDLAGLRAPPGRPAVRRAAAAGGAGAGAGAGAAGAAARRAALQPRSRAAGAHPARAARADPPDRDHHGDRDPRAG